jgi:hypothetical protein
MDEAKQPDRRAVARLPGTTIEPVRIQLDGGGETVAAVRDISIAGIGILLPQPLEPGTWVVLEPSRPKRRMSPPLQAEVRQATKCNDDYLIGCRFSRLLTMDDLMTLG